MSRFILPSNIQHPLCSTTIFLLFWLRSRVCKKLSKFVCNLAMFIGLGADYITFAMSHHWTLICPKHWHLCVIKCPLSGDKNLPSTKSVATNWCCDYTFYFSNFTIWNLSNRLSGMWNFAFEVHNPVGEFVPLELPEQGCHNLITVTSTVK